MSEDKVISKTLWDQLAAVFAGPKDASAPEPNPAAIPEDYSAAVKERDELKAKIEKIEAEKLHAETVSKLTADLQNKEKFSAEFGGTAAGEAAEILAGMTEDQQKWVTTRLAAMAKRIDYSKLTTELGSDGANVINNPVQAFNAAVESKMKTMHVDYPTALKMVSDETPDLLKAYIDAKGGK